MPVPVLMRRHHEQGLEQAPPPPSTPTPFPHTHTSHEHKSQANKHMHCHVASLLFLFCVCLLFEGALLADAEHLCKNSVHITCWCLHSAQNPNGTPAKACLSNESSFMQAEQRANTSAVQSALSHALQHVPMTNGANTGGSTQVRFHSSSRLRRYILRAGRLSKY